MDEDGSGEIEFDEFLVLMSRQILNSDVTYDCEKAFDAPAFASKNYTEKVTFSTTRSDPVGVEPDVRDSIMRSYSEYWNQLTRIALPYLPFIRFVF